MATKDEQLNMLQYGYKQALKGGDEAEAQMFLSKMQETMGNVTLPSPGPEPVDLPFPMGVVKSAQHEAGKIHRGIQEFDAKALNYFGLDEDFSDKFQSLDQQNVEADKAYEPYRKGNPVENIVGEMVPYMAGSAGVGRVWPTVSKVFPQGKNARRAHHLKTLAASPGTRGATEGGLFGAMHQDSDAVMGAALGYGGMKAGQALGGAMSRVPDELTKANRQTVQWADDQGFDLMPGLKSGNKTIQEVDRALSTNMKTSDWFNKREVQNRKLATHIVANRLGLEGVDELDGFAFRQANNNITRDIEKIAQKISARLNVDDQVELFNKSILPFRNSGSEGQQAAAKKLTKQWKRIYGKLADETPDRQGGKVLTGKQFQQIRRDFRNDIEAGFGKNATTEQRAYAQGLLQIQDLLNKGVDRQGMMTAGAGDWSKQWRDTNQRMRVLKDAQEAMTRGNNKFDGLIDPGKLYSIYTRDYPELMASGKFFDKDLMELANLGNLTKTQSGASLQASQQLGRVLNSGSGDAKEGLAGLLAMGSASAGPLMAPGLFLYKSGYPFTTGAFGLPTKTKKMFSDLGKQVGFSGMGEGGSVGNEYQKASSEVGKSVKDKYTQLKDAANTIAEWDKIMELKKHITD